MLVAGINQVKRNVRPNPMKNEVGGIVTKEAAISAANVAIYNAKHAKFRCRGDQGRRRSQAARVQVDRSNGLGGREHMARLKEQYQKEIVPALVEAVRLQVRHAGAAPDQDRGQHGCWRKRLAIKKILEHATGDLTAIVGQEAGHHQGQESYRELQDSRRLSGRHHGDAAQQADVRIPRSFRQRGAAARA